MATTTFTNGVTLTDEEWFNHVDTITYDGATTQILVGGGAGTIAAWTTATGTGDPVRGTSPTFTTSLVAGSTTMALLNTVATTINFGAAASTAINVGHASGTITCAGTLTAASDFGVGATKKLYLDGVALSGNTYIVESGGDVIDFYAGGVNTFRITTAGILSGVSGTGNISVNGYLAMTSTASPTGTGSGVTGQFAWDTSYFYVCTATNDWRRVALTDF